MIHLVNFWIKEECKTPENLAKFEKALDALCEIPGASSATWGTPAAVADRPVLDLSWDYNIVAYFDSVELHDAYQVHPEHLVFIEENKPLWEKVLVMDSELKG